MTLIAAFHPGGKYLTLMSDVLISSREEADSIVLPTRGYISPEQERRMPMRPVALRRKVIQINRKFVILWSGNLLCAEKLARRAREWFSKFVITKDGLDQFLSTYYNEPADISAFFVWYGGCAHFGHPPYIRGETKHYGKYLAAGSGRERFAELINGSQGQLGKLTMAEDLPEIHALNLCSEFLAREIYLNETILSQFGGGFELLVPGPEGYQCVDDIMHIFVTKRVDDPSDTRPYPHVIRQWYEGDRLYINSMSSQEAEAAGHGRLLYCIRDILSERHESSLLESLPLRPNYVCIHHGFLDKTGTLPVVLVLKKENIDRAITFTPTNSGFDIRFTAEYDAEVRRVADSIRSRESG